MNQLENVPSSYRQKRIYFAWVFKKLQFWSLTTWSSSLRPSIIWSLIGWWFRQSSNRQIHSLIFIRKNCPYELGLIQQPISNQIIRGPSCYRPKLSAKPTRNTRFFADINSDHFRVHLCIDLHLQEVIWDLRAPRTKKIALVTTIPERMSCWMRKYYENQKYNCQRIHWSPVDHMTKSEKKIDPIQVDQRGSCHVQKSRIRS